MGFDLGERPRNARERSGALADGATTAAYRKASNENKVSETSLEGSFDRASDEQLRAAGWEIAKSYWAEDHAVTQEQMPTDSGVAAVLRV